MDRKFFKHSNQTKLDLITGYCNKLLVYLHCCLCGQSYPFGRIEDDQLSDRVRKTTFDYLIAIQSDLINGLFEKEMMKQNCVDYPVLKMFLSINALDFLNVIAMSFSETSFEVSL